MTINIFEGARRAAKVFGGLWCLGWVISAFAVSRIEGAAVVAFFVLTALGWFAIWSVGWIVRGMLGIPSGQDFKPPAAAPATTTHNSA